MVYDSNHFDSISNEFAYRVYGEDVSTFREQAKTFLNCLITSTGFPYLVHYFCQALDSASLLRSTIDERKNVTEDIVDAFDASAYRCSHVISEILNDECERGADNGKK